MSPVGRSLPLAPKAEPGRRNLPLAEWAVAAARSGLQSASVSIDGGETRHDRLRERLVHIEATPGEPFDHGRFVIVVEEVNRESAASLPLL